MSGSGGAFIDSIANSDSVGAGDGVKPTMFKMRAQLLDQGRSNMYLAKTKNMWATLKVYASGGENALHAHPSEDHMFVVMQGTARFFGPNDETADLARYQGIMLPAGSFYYFQSTSEEPLVLMRVGCRVGPQDPSGRIDLNGEVMHSDSAENGREEVIPRPNAYFD
jgi:oxalate decarboxylase/phosphoglucose isomerase-like protein (cupin superfamily)